MVVAGGGGGGGVVGDPGPEAAVPLLAPPLLTGATAAPSLRLPLRIRRAPRVGSLIQMPRLSSAGLTCLLRCQLSAPSPSSSSPSLGWSFLRIWPVGSLAAGASVVGGEDELGEAALQGHARSPVYPSPAQRPFTVKLLPFFRLVFSPDRACGELGGGGVRCRRRRRSGGGCSSRPCAASRASSTGSAPLRRQAPPLL